MSINITSRAVEQLKSKPVDELKVHRITINGFGWGGPVFGITLDEKFEGDFVKEIDGFKFAVESNLIDQFGNFTIDYISNFFRKGFVVSTEKGTSSCS